jgi:hypothetical protein
MSFQEPPNQPDFGKLLFILNQSKMQMENPALYQCIKQLIGQTQQMQGLFVNDIAAAATTGGTVTGDFYPAQLGHAGF